MIERASRARDPGLALAVAKAGGFSALGAAIGVSKQTVHGWPRVPQMRVIEISKVCGVAPEDIRPDLIEWIGAQRAAEREARMALARERFSLVKAAVDRHLPPPKGCGGVDFAADALTTVAACRFVAEARGMTFAAVCAGARREDQAARSHAMALAHVIGRATSAAVGSFFGTSRQNVDNASERYMRARDGDDPEDFVAFGADGKGRVIERGRVRRAKDAAEDLWTLERRFAALLAGDDDRERKRA